MRNRFSMWLLLTLLLVTACSEVDLCTNATHPHSATVSFDFVWDDSNHRPDTMAIVAYRVVNNWKRMFSVNAETKKGFYLNPQTAAASANNTSGTTSGANTNTETNTTTGNANTDSDDSSSGGMDVTVEEEGSGSEEESTGSEQTKTPGVDVETGTFSIRQGDYKFIAVSGDKDAQDLTEIYDFVNEKKGLRDICVNYYDFDKDDPRLQSRLTGWTDYNQYARYIQPAVSPIHYDTVSIVKVQEGEHVTCTFRPKSITQNIDVYFTIAKDITSAPFVIDSVWAEISGVPRSVSVANGYLDITRTAKMMFPMELTPGSETSTGADGYDNTTVKCHGNIDVTSIVNVQQLEGEDLETVRKKVYGPGIMQVIIFTHSKQINSEGNHVSKKIQGVINLYNTLKNADLISISEDGRYATRRTPHGTLNINAQMTINGSSIVNNPDDTGGIDRWLTVEDIIIDI